MSIDEAATLVRASDDGVNDYVVKLFGVARGLAPSWAAAVERARATLAEKGVAGAAAPAAAQASGGTPLQLLGLVTDWQEGGSLDVALFPLAAERAPWPQDLADKLRLLCEVAEGLWRLHGSGIVHGDVKSENVLLSANTGAERHPRLADFGFAQLRAVADQAARASKISLAHEATDIVKGTPAYMAPEMKPSRANGVVVLAIAADRRTDTYAFGTLAWELLVGERPWDGYDEASRLADVRSGKTLDLGKLPRLLPKSVDALLARCLALDRAARPRMVEVLQVLEQARDALEGGGRRRQVFLSYCWGRGERRKPLATEVYVALLHEGFSVWLDDVEMKHDMHKSMYEGVSNCDVVVALITPDYAASENCLFELRCAASAKKPVVACCAEPGFWRSWKLADGSRAIPDEHEVAGLSNLQKNQWVDLGEASSVDWTAEPVPDAERRKLTQKPEALPRLLKLVREMIAGAAAVGGGGAAPRRSPSAPYALTRQGSADAHADLPAELRALAAALRQLAAEDCEHSQASGGAVADKKRALQTLSENLDKGLAKLRATVDAARRLAGEKEAAVAKVTAKAKQLDDDAKALGERAAELYKAAIDKSPTATDEPARIKLVADNLRAAEMKREAVSELEEASYLRADAKALHDAVAEAAAAEAVAKGRKESLAAAVAAAKAADAAAAKAADAASAAEMQREYADELAHEADAERRAALTAAGFPGSDSSAAAIDAAIANIRVLLKKRLETAEAENAVPGTALDRVAESARDAELTARAERLGAARAAAARKDEEAERLRVAARGDNVVVVVATAPSAADAAAAAAGRALLDACRQRDADLAMELIRKGAAVNAIGPDGNTALLLACEDYFDLDLGNYLGYFVRSFLSNTTLAEVALELLKKGADVSARARIHGPTALQIACSSGLDAVACALIDNGADVNATSNNVFVGKSTALDICRAPMFWSRTPHARAKLLALNAARCRGFFEELDHLVVDRFKSTVSFFAFVLFYPWYALCWGSVIFSSLVLLVHIMVVLLSILFNILCGGGPRFDAFSDEDTRSLYLVVYKVFMFPLHLALVACMLPIGAVLPFWCLLEMILYRRFYP